jgi:hypothetical protein
LVLRGGTLTWLFERRADPNLRSLPNSLGVQ